MNKVTIFSDFFYPYLPKCHNNASSIFFKIHLFLDAQKKGNLEVDFNFI